MKWRWRVLCTRRGFLMYIFKLKIYRNSTNSFRNYSTCKGLMGKSTLVSSTVVYMCMTSKNHLFLPFPPFFLHAQTSGISIQRDTYNRNVTISRQNLLFAHTFYCWSEPVNRFLLDSNSIHIYPSQSICMGILAASSIDQQFDYQSRHHRYTRPCSFATVYIQCWWYVSTLSSQPSGSVLCSLSLCSQIILYKDTLYVYFKKIKYYPIEFFLSFLHIWCMMEVKIGSLTGHFSLYISLYSKVVVVEKKERKRKSKKNKK